MRESYFGKMDFFAVVAVRMGEGRGLLFGLSNNFWRDQLRKYLGPQRMLAKNLIVFFHYFL